LVLHSEVGKEWETLRVIYKEIATSGGGRRKCVQTTAGLLWINSKKRQESSVRRIQHC